ncbi:MAG: enoyl-CoA hydratase/isomerase family protein [Dehalococcoidia bacterium]|nr:enoyl-CoA hydratase/isomerase family protein [Dehalococcoidia bacterium]
MDYQDIIYEVDGPAAVITLNRPERLNAWTPTMQREYRDAMERADKDPAVRGVILTGAGRGFCAGADMGNLNSIASGGGSNPAAAHAATAAAGGIEANYQEPHSWPLAMRKPLIAAVNGPAAGLGLVTTFYADMRFASQSARFGTAFSKLGLIAEHGASWLLPRMVGTANALDLLYSSRVIGADEALRIGLVQRVYPDDELIPATKEYVATLARTISPRAMMITKRLVYDSLFQDLREAVAAADEGIRVTTSSPDFKEGLAAFAEKRDPVWPPLE